MIDACGAIPRKSPVPFHVAIEREHFAGRIEVEIVRVSEASQNQFPFFAVGICSHDITAGSEDTDCMSIGIPLASEEKILLIIPMWRGWLNAGRDLSVIPVHHVDHFVRSKSQGVITVLTFAGEVSTVITPWLLDRTK